MPATAPVQKQQGLNQVVINKVRRMIEGRQGDVMDTINRLLSEGRIAQDFIAPIGVSQRSKERPVISFKAEGRVQMAMPEGNFNLHGNAISQISEKMGIPAKYLRELSAGDVWQKQLCATILNEHSGWTERTRILIRAVGMEVRGVLSDSYRRLNSVDILTAFIREAGGQGAVVSDAYMNDTKVWCETILPTPIEIPTRKNGTVIIFAGARFSTSDYGNGSVDMRSFLLNDGQHPFTALHNFNLRYIEQFKLLFSSPLYAWNDFPLITAERYIFPVNIPVATFQFLNQSAFGYLPVSNQTVTAHIKT